MFKRKLYQHIRIFIAIGMAYMLSGFMIKEVFIAGTPQVRPDLAVVMKDRIYALANMNNYMAFLQQGIFRKPIPKKPDDLPYQSTQAIGIYAAETEDTTYYEYRLDEMVWIEIPYVKQDGTTVYIKIPKGEDPPPLGLF